MIQVKDLKKYNLLYIEDDDLSQELILRNVTKHFNSVIVAKNGKTGYEKYLQNRDKIDVIVTDINMPEVNGLEMIKQIRKLDSNIPIMILTAYSDSSYLFESIELHVSSYIQKPFDIHDFLEKIAKAIEPNILKQKLKKYNSRLEELVHQRTKELKKLNQNLETKVKNEIEKNKHKDKILEQQARLASMGEMIDAVAHNGSNQLVC